ncbi:amidase [Streptomyces sp. CA2R106]|uniref:amidase n=1 Tax=Streptomyces sp. CA2R106 TaxID=3120153 RepID=UPI003008F0E4
MTAAEAFGALKDRLRRGETTVVEHVGSVLAAAHERDTLGAFVAVAGQEALRAAEAADLRIAERGADAWTGAPLLGVTVSVKDLLQTRDLPTARGSFLANRRERADAPAVARLRAAGAIVIGKTTTSEYGWSASTVSRVAPPTGNPYDPARTAGGSSGGAAAAVATGLGDGALGTDGAGSVRIPAAFCGVVGYKPSYGLIPYVPGCADRLSHQGTLARGVAEAAALAAAAGGPHPGDPDSGLGSIEAPPRGAARRVGWIEWDGTSDEVRRVAERARSALAELGYRVEPVEVRCTDLYPALVDILAAAEAAGTAARDEELCDPGRLEVVRYGRRLTGAAVLRAEEVRQRTRVRLRAVMARHELLAMATVPVEPFEAGAIAPTWAADPRDLLWLAWSPATYPFNLTGQPALTLPAGLTRAGLPVGVQLVGAFGADEPVIAAARRLESALGQLPPPRAPHELVAATERTL